MAHRNDHLTHTQAYNLKLATIFELWSRFIRTVKEKIDIFSYASGNPLRPHYEPNQGADQFLSEALNRSQFQFR